MDWEQEEIIDHCSWFPEYWIVWSSPLTWRIEYIGNECKLHDDTCSFTKFIHRLWKRRVVGYIPIAVVAGLGCWFKYPRRMFKRV